MNIYQEAQKRVDNAINKLNSTKTVSGFKEGRSKVINKTLKSISNKKDRVA